MTTLAPRGMALIAVLWLVAAMSLILAGVVRTVRSEAQMAGQQRQAAIAGAKADAAILLALQALHAEQKELPKGLQTMAFEFDGVGLQVQISALNGLIDLNSAPVALLTDLYVVAAGMSLQAAQAMAQATLDTRQLKNAKNIEQGFEAVADLMRVPSMSYDLYAKVADLVTADIRSGSGRVNPSAAPFNVLLVLTAGNAARAAQFISQRDSDPTTLDSTFFKPESIEMSASNSLKFQANVGLPDGATLQKTWLIYWSPDPRSDLPWRVLGKRQLVLARAPVDQ